jgi:glycosyltransferase involved in cell wall biosynthesis
MSNAARILEVFSYPPPLSGWSVRIQFLKERLESMGHTCTVLNIGPSRAVPSPEYECVLGGADFVAKLWRFSRSGYRVHAHANGHSPKGLALALAALLVNALWGRRPVLTFHGGAAQTYFPRARTPLVMLPAFVAAFAAASRIVCNNEVVKNSLAAYGVHPSKISAIPAFSSEYFAFEPVVLPPAVEAFLTRWPETVFTYIRLRAIFYTDELMEAFETLARVRPSVGFLICGIGEHAEGDVATRFRSHLQGAALEDRVLCLADLERRSFLTALARAKVCVRSPTTDGVSSSVLEALTLRIPVVASENGNRPPGVITYAATDVADLVSKLTTVLDDRERIARHLPVITADDTLTLEVGLLIDP